MGDQTPQPLGHPGGHCPARPALAVGRWLADPVCRVPGDLGNRSDRLDGREEPQDRLAPPLLRLASPPIVVFQCVGPQVGSKAYSSHPSFYITAPGDAIIALRYCVER